MHQTWLYECCQKARRLEQIIRYTNNQNRHSLQGKEISCWLQCKLYINNTTRITNISAIKYRTMEMNQRLLTFCSLLPSPSWVSASMTSNCHARETRSRLSSSVLDSATRLESLMPCTTVQRSSWATQAVETLHLPAQTQWASVRLCRLSKSFTMLSEYKRWSHHHFLSVDPRRYKRLIAF